MLSKRVEILLEPGEMQALQRYAKKARKSVGALIRDAVKEKYLTPSSQERLAAVQGLTSPKRAVDFPPWEELKKELERGIGGKIAAR